MRYKYKQIRKKKGNLDDNTGDQLKNRFIK